MRIGYSQFESRRATRGIFSTAWLAVQAFYPCDLEPASPRPGPSPCHGPRLQLLFVPLKLSESHDVCDQQAQAESFWSVWAAQGPNPLCQEH